MKSISSNVWREGVCLPQLLWRKIVKMKRIIKYLIDISGFMIIAAMPCVVMYMLGHIGTNVIEQGYCDYGIRLILICYFFILVSNTILRCSACLRQKSICSDVQWRRVSSMTAAVVCMILSCYFLSGYIYFTFICESGLKDLLLLSSAFFMAYGISELNICHSCSTGSNKAKSQRI